MDLPSYGRVVEALLLVPTQQQYVSTFTNTVVWDGPWTESNEPDYLVMIGYDDNGEAEAEGTSDPATMAPYGAGRHQEEYGIPCKIKGWTGDSGAGAQKFVRDAVMAQYAAYYVTIRTNPTLNGLIVDPPSGQKPSITIESNSFAQTDPDVTAGRVFAVKFTVHVSNSLNA